MAEPCMVVRVLDFLLRVTFGACLRSPDPAPFQDLSDRFVKRRDDHVPLSGVT